MKISKLFLIIFYFIVLPAVFIYRNAVTAPSLSKLTFEAHMVMPSLVYPSLRFEDQTLASLPLCRLFFPENSMEPFKIDFFLKKVISAFKTNTVFDDFIEVKDVTGKNIPGHASSFSFDLSASELYHSETNVDLEQVSKNLSLILTNNLLSYALSNQNILIAHIEPYFSCIKQSLAHNGDRNENFSKLNKQIEPIERYIDWFRKANSLIQSSESKHLAAFYDLKVKDSNFSASSLFFNEIDESAKSVRITGLNLKSINDNTYHSPLYILKIYLSFLFSGLAFLMIWPALQSVWNEIRSQFKKLN